MKLSVISELNEKLDKLLKEENSEIEPVNICMEAGNTLAIYLWKKGGIDLDTLEKYSRKIERILDEDMDIEESYNLAVSSPNWSKGIKTEEDLRRNIDEKLEFRLRQPIENEYKVVGILKSFDEENMVILGDSNELIIPRKDIKKVTVYFSI